jgi:hypothetical protein
VESRFSTGQKELRVEREEFCLKIISAIFCRISGRYPFQICQEPRLDMTVRDDKMPQQLHFPWIPSGFRHNCWRKRRWQRRSRIRKLRWPPRIGEKVAFWTDFGIQIGILREIQEGLVCFQYVMADSQIVMEHELIMGPGRDNWRDPDSVSEEERRACARRIQAAHGSRPEKDLTEMPEWADFCPYTAYIWLKRAKERERAEFAVMQTGSPGIERPN